MSESNSTAADSSFATAFKLFLAFVAGAVVGAAVCWSSLHLRAVRGAGQIHSEPAALVFDQQRGDTLRPALPLVPSTPPPETADATAAIDTSAAVDGIAAGATLGLLPVTSEEQSDENSVKHFILHIPIKARPNVHINVKDLVLHILFYDLVDGQTVVQTSANVNFRWVTPPADWRDTDTEELAVEYQLPKPAATAATASKRADRKYYGYLVRIYYQQRLQAATAEPDRLRQQYPSPPILPK